MTQPTGAPAVRATPGGLRELTIRGIVIGGLITLVFTAANVYLGLKVGLTFATSIPAAVISMGILRNFRNHTITENNIVQTIASAAGTLSAIIFVLPGLVMIGWWTGFPYWTTVAICAVGGVLGVMYSIPLRRALVTGSDLPYPEGVAAAEVLKVGDTAGGAQANKRGLHVIVAGGLSSAGLALLSAMKLVAGGVSTVFRVGAGGTMFGASLTLALVGVGHLVGIAVGIAMIVGVLIAYGVLLPIRSAGVPGPLADVVASTFSGDVRFIGAGAIGIAAIWTLIKIIRPIATGITEAAASARLRRSGHQVALTERDIPIRIVGIVILASMVPIGLLLWSFLRGTPLAGDATSLITVSIIFILLIGLIVASVCGYMAGLIGASNSPISGVGILVVLAAAVLLRVTHGVGTGDEVTAIVAYTLFTAAVVFSVATISNDNLQDLKTGQLVGATPWKQQVALIIGVVFGSLVIPPILDLMQTAFGFQGAPGAGPNALAAPQAGLISALAQGVFGGSLDWGLIGLGALIGAGVITVDEVLRAGSKGRFSLPPLAVGMGMYLPIQLTLTIPLGALIGLLYNRWAERTGKNVEGKKRTGILLATGLIVGESLFGVVLAGVVAATGNEAPLAVVGSGYPEWLSSTLGVLVFLGIIWVLYRWIRRITARDDELDAG
ncbi:OPT family oligopeptide transporter [Granulicoccus phenolivorans]|uniref:OPT family oligopeptide transporter n=1 Tax=Granulicoccus phenolivorans TaxID=266854 RepID=UPI00041CE5BE|nr:oligopeptide transporter, OPT family [Granulicoccus phenolivorans]